VEQSDLISVVRAECGKVTNIEELEDTDILKQAGFILTRIAEKVVDREVRYITSEANVREYDVHANTVRVQDVIPSDTQGSDTMELGSHHRAEFDPESSELYQWPSLHVIKLQRRIRGLPPIHFEFSPVSRKLKIDPMPSQAGIKYYYWSVEKTYWTLVNLPNDFEELMATGTAWKCMEIIIMKRSNLGGIMRGGGLVDFPATRMRIFITAKRDEFFDSLKQKSMIYNL